MTSLSRLSGSEIDWKALHVRLANNAASMRAATEPSRARAAAILDERARRLARPLAAARATGAMLDLLGFMLRGERYAIETRYVQEVVRFAGVTPVPNVPDFVAGLANLRGQILVVFDIRPLLGLARREPTDASRIVVCGKAEPDVGLIAEAVGEVSSMAADEVLTGTPPEERGAASLVRGIGGDAMIVLDGAALLADRRLFVEPQRRQ